MKTKENKIKITLKTIIILAFAFFTILSILISTSGYILFALSINKILYAFQ